MVVVFKMSVRGHSYRFLVCLSTLLLAYHCDWVNSQLVDDDISVIKNNSDFCISALQDGVEILAASLGTSPGSIVVSWEPNSASSPPASEYQLLYRPLSSTVVQIKSVSLSESRTTLSGLQNSLTYEIYVRLGCNEGGVGRLSEGKNVTLIAAKPANVTGVGANVTDNVVTVFWDPLPEDQWNGVPLGYQIRFDGPGSSDPFRRVNYPQTVYSEGLRNGRYTVTVYAVNERSFSDASSSSQTDIVVVSSSSNPGGHPGDVQVLEYPWTYILIPGLVCVAIIIVIALVMCKKIREKKKRAVTYCRDIEEKMYAANVNGGFNNIIPLNNLNSPVTSTSLSIPNSSPTASCSAHQPNPLATRPLPSSPMSEVSPTFIEQDVPRFGNGMASNHQPPPERKMPHPGGLPLLHEAAEPGFVQMHRTNTNQSVFSSSGASAPPNSGHVQRTMRGRAQTVGGIPSPYEVPEQNGNTLPRGAGEHHHHHRMAHHHQHGHGGGIFQVGMGVSIPPPPAHSPPPLTHSSMEIRARMADDVFSPPGQHTLPRSMGSSRSYSVTSPHSGTGGGGSDVIRHMKSDGHLPILETHEEKIVYIQAPLDSSVEASIHSSSSYGGAGGGVGVAAVGGVVVGGANERRPSPHHHTSNYHHTHHSHASGMGQPPHMMHHANTSATYVPGSESFSEMTSEPGSIQSGIPRMPMHHPHSFSRERSNRSAGGGVGGGGRESVFSETSTELSISSTSDKEMSPSWDHRGTTSEVGVGFRHPLDDPPTDREAYSDVGTPGQLPGHSQRVYKQV